MSTKKYILDIAGLKRELSLIDLNENLRIASFVMLGDTELTVHCARELIKRFPSDDFDYFIVPETKSIPLAQAICQEYESKGFKDYIVLRKSIKSYMQNPIKTKVNSITTVEPQILVLNGPDAEKINGKKICLIDDVISTGNSYRAMVDLVSHTEARINFAGAVLREGEFDLSDIEKKISKPLTFLGYIPIFKR